ncbi:alpha/beta hydrolase [Longimicrobium sp.]|uniref:alpha/beta fold hydrolase n=1 Tax=Longimicrobium sp. TaxID=2029185 RepID=UPI002E3493CC|nr:alpha/beta hydrolase [Longimicrobium sp.]HEX6041926.1 alpha/beta hydrolase [Longimicrobium sp.]
MAEARTRVMDVNGLRMRVTEQGSGPLVLLCHGFPETAYAWRHQLAALADAGYHAVAPDLRGYGGTEGPDRADQYTLFHLVGDVVALLDALDAPRAALVGNDWGATLAWQAALMRPDRVRGVAAMGVPMMGQPPRPPTQLFPATPDALFYTLYFQAPGVAEAELERDVRDSLLRILYAASGDAGPRVPGDGTPNPFSMVSRADGLLAPLPAPASLPSWLAEADLDAFTAAFTASGFGGGLNWYRNLDRNWELQASLAGMRVEVPALYLAGERDPGLAMPGMRQIIDAMPLLVPRLTGAHVIPGGGHWIQQEKPDEVNALLLSFLRSLPG